MSIWSEAAVGRTKFRQRKPARSAPHPCSFEAPIRRMGTGTAGTSAQAASPWAGSNLRCCSKAKTSPKISSEHDTTDGQSLQEREERADAGKRQVKLSQERLPIHSPQAGRALAWGRGQACDPNPAPWASLQSIPPPQSELLPATELTRSPSPEPRHSLAQPLRNSGHFGPLGRTGNSDSTARTSGSRLGSSEVSSRSWVLQSRLGAGLG